MIDALLTGAGNTLRICGYLIANLIAFISVLRFADVVISWFFGLIHYPEINFQFLLGLAFYPFAIIIGISLRDCLLASKLIGIKVSLNEVSISNYFKDIASFRSIVYCLSTTWKNSTIS